MERCRREIAAIEAELLAGNPDLPGLCPALSDWSEELRNCKPRFDRVKILSRIERLEDELLPLPAGDTLLLHIDGVDEEGKVVSTQVFEVHMPPPANRRERRYRGPAPRREW